MLNAEGGSAELEELWCLIEQQRVEIQSQRRLIELQRRRTDHLEAELAQIQRAVSTPQPTQGSPGNGSRHRAGRDLRSETIPRATRRHLSSGPPSRT